MKPAALTLTTLTLATFLAPAALAQAVRDTKNPDSARTDADHVTMPVLREQMYRIVHARLVETFEAGVGADVNRDAALELLSLAADRFITERWERDWKPVADFARAHDLASHPSPMVRAAAILAIDAGEDHPADAQHGAIETLHQLQDTTAPHLFLAELGVGITTLSEFYGKNENAEQARTIALEEYRRALTAPALSRSERRLIYEYASYTLGDRWPEKWAAPFVEQLTDTPGVDPWLFKAITGSYDLDRAWDRRGSKFVNQTDPDDLKAFYDALPRARQTLEEAYWIDPLCPEPASVLIRLVMAEGDDKLERRWFDIATEAQADYIPAYSAMEYALRPRWGGSHEAMREFGLEISRRELPGTRVANMVYIMLEAIIFEEGLDQAPAWRQDELTVAAFLALDSLIQDPLQSKRAPMWRTKLAALAHVVGHDPLAAEQVRALDGEMHFHTLEVYGLAHRDFASIILPHEPGATSAAAADELERKRLYDQAITMWEKAIADADETGDALMARATRTRLLRAQRTRDALSGAWTPIHFDEALTGLVPIEGGEWSRVDDDTVRMKLVGRRACALLDLELPTPYEIEVRTRIDFAPTGATYMSSGVLVAGEPSMASVPFARVEAAPFLPPHGNMFIGSRTSYLSDSYMSKVPGYEFDVKNMAEAADGFAIRVRFDGRLYTVWIDGKQAWHAPGPPRTSQLSGPLVGLSASWGARDAVYEFSNIRVRKLPPANNED
ncbi:MAG: hypothetical protein R3B57_13445 [Phycisphaerales bacterium]